VSPIHLPHLGLSLLLVSIESRRSLAKVSGGTRGIHAHIGQGRVKSNRPLHFLVAKESLKESQVAVIECRIFGEKFDEILAKQLDLLLDIEVL
jgi:hypothetical protein